MLLRLALIAALALQLTASPILFHIEPTFADTAKKKKKRGYKRSDFTEEQREKIMENARKACKKSYGSAARVYKIDYSRNQIWCVPS